MSTDQNNKTRDMLIHTVHTIPLVIAAELHRLFQEHPEATWLIDRAKELDPEGHK